MNGAQLPVAVIGAGPVGLAAAAHLVDRGETPVVLEAGEAVGAHVLQWGHVRIFSPWKSNVDPVAASMLEAAGWSPPPPTELPTGRELVERYLQPLAELPRIRPHVRLGARVLSIARRGFDKMKTDGRDEAPFSVLVRTATGEEREVVAKAVIDASGTYGSPNPLGGSGVPVAGERALGNRVFYGIPDVLGADRARYAGRRVMVVGSGHSAFNTLLDLAELSEQEPRTRVTWVVRRPDVGHLFGGEDRDKLPARGSLGARLRTLIDREAVDLRTGFALSGLRSTPDGIVAESADRSLEPVDEIVATTGYRPDLEILRELRLGLDTALDSPTALAPLIDPNVHSCGTVPPHGEAELRHPETGFYMVGMKSYGRAPTFLMLTGYEQVRSVVAAIAGDWQAARSVELVLPETGACNTDLRVPVAVGAGAPTKQAVCCG